MNRLISGGLITFLISLNCVYAQGLLTEQPAVTQASTAFYSGMSQSVQNENVFTAQSPQDSGTTENILFEVPPTVYMHVYGGMGFSYLSSSDVGSLLGDDFGIGIGLPTWSWGLIGGYKNIAQVEYNNGISDHNFNHNSIIPSIPSEVVEMDYRTTDWQFKINPLFWNMDDDRAFFLIIGSGDVEWRDNNNDGFSGTTQIFGVEYAKIAKYLSWSVSFKRYGNTFDKTILFDIPFDFETKAADYILEIKVGIGYGI